MTDPKWAVATDRGRYYQDPAGGPDLISVTNALSSIAKPALVPWAAGLTADAVIADPIATARRARTEPTALRRELVAVSREYTDKARDLGTRVHLRAVSLVLNTPYPYDPEVEPYAVQLAAWFRLWRVDFERDVLAVEMTVMNRKRGYAGTGDLWVWLPTGRYRRRQLWLIDYKTSAKKPASTVYDDQPLQLAGLRHAPEWLLPDDSSEPAPRVHRTALLNLRTRSRRLIEVPSGRRQFRAFLGALETSRYLHDAPTSYPAVDPPWAPGASDRKAA
ncbi:hypothetical protein OHA98_41795 [Streptomyces sp. NBC_00654]|uniref:hypothetical protein n=1 Tax=Streptomyces sp. NBC_00654 TaxID=2975799 RepID=UPI00224DD13B|nr:hypothetical protein [Streptomyces sp. NBC_00654]MCX4969362.1 hypothetical protein [Streptomyces sp. NBC_00654]MCX4971141.1 hypothetical protein [Streptomyces sp. NBC_00654]